jgi:hypothetical protein
VFVKALKFNFVANLTFGANTTENNVNCFSASQNKRTWADLCSRRALLETALSILYLDYSSDDFGEWMVEWKKDSDDKGSGARLPK